MTEEPETTALELALASAVAGVLSAPSLTEDTARQLCEATRSVLQAFLREEPEWPGDSFIDGLMPLSIERAEEGALALEMAAAAMVARDEHTTVEPLLARFAIAGEQVMDFAILFGDASREPPGFEADFDYATLAFPIESDSWRYKFGVVTE